MSKVVQVALLAVIGLAVVAAATPELAKLAGALTPLIVAVGLVAMVLRAVWYFTRS